MCKVNLKLLLNYRYIWAARCPFRIPNYTGLIQGAEGVADRNLSNITPSTFVETLLLGVGIKSVEAVRRPHGEFHIHSSLLTEKMCSY